jgi:hypothetical protein
MSGIDGRLVRIVEFLNQHHIRATYAAVGETAEVGTRSVGALLGDRTPLASWVVSGDTGEPTNYTEAEKHQALRERVEVITTGDDLTRAMKRGFEAWLLSHRAKQNKAR